MDVLLARKADVSVKDNVSRGKGCEGAPMVGSGVMTGFVGSGSRFFLHGLMIMSDGGGLGWVGVLR